MYLFNRHQNPKVISRFFFLEVVIKIEVKDNNIEQALRVLKRKLQRDGFFKVIKLKNTYEKPSEKKKRILQENIKRVKKLNKLKNRI
jgi:small subunit ribosomal protein S21